MVSEQRTKSAETAGGHENIGAPSPYALVEALLRRKVDWSDPTSAELMADILQTDYDELFDPKFNSPLWAGFRLKKSTNELERIPDSEIEIIEESDQVTPDLSKIKTLSDLQHFGVGDIGKIEVKHASLEHGNLKLKLKVPALDRTITNSRLTKRFANLVLPRLQERITASWTPAGYTWSDTGDYFKDVTEFSDPVQGFIPDCWMWAALAAVAWADPFSIKHANRSGGPGEKDRVNQIVFFKRGGSHEGSGTPKIEVTDKVLTNNVTGKLDFGGSTDAGEIWPALYQKAWAKWASNEGSDTPNLTVLGYGDALRAICTITGRDSANAVEMDTLSHTPDQLYGFVRENSSLYKTLNPMVAWTYASGSQYNGSNIVANHAYTVLGFASANGRNYIILRNPWAKTEPTGVNTTYQGLLFFFDTSFWRWIDMVPNDGVFALEASAFKFYFAGIGVQK